MKPDFPDDIQEAIELFDKFIIKLPSLEGMEYLTDAIEIIDDYIEFNQTSPDIKRISNIKNTYIKRVIKEMQSCDSSEFGEWLKMKITFFGKSKIRNIIDSDQELTRIYNDFTNEWKESSELKRFVKSVLE